MSGILLAFSKKNAVSPEAGIQRAADLFCQWQSLETATVHLRHEENGRPYLEGSPLQISISHSGSVWGCAVSEKAVGLDIQQIREQEVRQIARRFFHPLEYDHLKETNFQDFFSIWSAKESYVKYTGEGITDSFGAFSVADEKGLRSELPGTCLRRVPILPGYSVCVCSQEKEELLVYSWL